MLDAYCSLSLQHCELHTRRRRPTLQWLTTPACRSYDRWRVCMHHSLRKNRRGAIGWQCWPITYTDNLDWQVLIDIDGYINRTRPLSSHCWWIINIKLKMQLRLQLSWRHRNSQWYTSWRHCIFAVWRQAPDMTSLDRHWHDCFKV